MFIDIQRCTTDKNINDTYQIADDFNDQFVTIKRKLENQIQRVLNAHFFLWLWHTLFFFV